MRHEAALGLLLSLLLAGAPQAQAATWRADQVQVPGATTTYSISQSGRAAASGPDSRIHLVYQSLLSEGNFEIRYVERQSGGSWSEPLLISEGANSRNASICAARDGALHVVWEDLSNTLGDIRYRKRSPTGEWGAVQSLSTGGGISKDPVVAVDTFGRVHVVWVDASVGFPQILYRRHADDTGWTGPQLLSAGGSSPESPTITADGWGVVHVAWSDKTGDTGPGGLINHEIFYHRFEPDAEPPYAPVRLTNDLSISRLPFLESTEDGTVYLVWIDNRGSSGAAVFEVFYRRFLPGIGWGRDKRFSYDGVDQSRPVIAVGGDNTLNIAWEDYRHGNPEIYFRQITDAYGWDPRPTRLTTDLSSSVRPTLLALPDGGLFILWTDGIEAGTLRVFGRSGSVHGSSPE